jgi:hypothetical protein
MEFRTILAAVGTAMTALGIGFVILSQPAFQPVNEGENHLGWALLAFGVLLLLVALVWSLRVAMRKVPQPNLVVEAGNSGAFRQRRPGRERHHLPGDSTYISCVHETRLLVREANGVEAPRVTVKVVATDPPPDPEGLETVPATLRWTSELYEQNFTGNDRAHAILVEFVEYGGPRGLRTDHEHGNVPHVKRGEAVTIEVQTYVDLRPNTRATFTVSWPEAAEYPTVTAEA